MVIWSLVFFTLLRIRLTGCTIDINLSELEYLAVHLDPFECRRLVAALHYDSYDLPKNLAGAERQINEDIPCLRQLLHWNIEEGRGRTHEQVGRRLRQLGHNELADWLGKTAFKELGKDLLRSIDEFDVIPRTSTEIRHYTTTTEEVTDEDDFRPSIETILMVVFTALLFTFILVVGMLIIDRFAWCRS